MGVDTGVMLHSSAPVNLDNLHLNVRIGRSNRNIFLVFSSICLGWDSQLHLLLLSCSFVAPFLILRCWNHNCVPLFSTKEADVKSPLLKKHHMNISAWVTSDRFSSAVVAAAPMIPRCSCRLFWLIEQKSHRFHFEEITEPFNKMTTF